MVGDGRPRPEGGQRQVGCLPAKATETPPEPVQASPTLDVLRRCRMRLPAGYTSLGYGGRTNQSPYSSHFHRRAQTSIDAEGYRLSLGVAGGFGDEGRENSCC